MGWVNFWRHSEDATSRLVRALEAQPLRRAMSHSFEKGDSNRCRNAYERILHAELPMGALNVQKKNKARHRNFALL